MSNFFHILWKFKALKTVLNKYAFHSHPVKQIYYKCTTWVLTSNQQKKSSTLREAKSRNCIKTFYNSSNAIFLHQHVSSSLDLNTRKEFKIITEQKIKQKQIKSHKILYFLPPVKKEHKIGYYITLNSTFAMK